MKNLSKLSAILLYVVISTAASAQEMPPGQIIRTLNCSLNSGVNMGQVVEWGRNLPRDEYTPNAIFFREAIQAQSNFRDNFDFQIAWYHGSWEQYVMRLEGNRDGALAFRQFVRPTDLMTCDSGTDRLVRSRTVPDLDGFEGADTLMLTRVCFMTEESTYRDAWGWLVAVTENFRRAGSTSLVQMNTRHVGPFSDFNAEGLRGFMIQEVGSTPQSLATRMGSSLGMNVQEGTEPVIKRCNAPALWRTYAIYRAPQ